MTSSCSVNRIIANHRNAVRDAAIVASAQRASADIRLLGQSRRGGGRMVLAGPYEGEVDAVVDVEVIDGTVGALRHSAPVIQGVGNGELSIEAVDIGALPDTLVFTLADAGTPAKHAVLDFFGTQLAAKVAGTAGNAISITVEQHLTFDEMPYSTLSAIPEGMRELEGQAWNWGQPPAAGAGIPPTALRVQFNGFPQIHRAWKEWRAGEFVYHLDPAPSWDVPADTKLIAVTGDYTLTVSDGSVTEVYAGMVTVYDFLAELRARSELVEVRGALAFDTAAGGMAVTDIPLRTDARALPETSSISSGRQVKLQGLEVEPTAPTENITIKCLGAAIRGGEAWEVEGGVSGLLPTAVTGEEYAHGPIKFKIPTIPRAAVDMEHIRGSFQYVTRTALEGLPGLCFKPLLTGSQARNKQITFRYERRPAADCSCEGLAPLPVSFSCLGLTDGDAGMGLEPDYQTRLIALYEWRALFFGHNTTTGPLAVAVRQDLDFADRVTGSFADTLGKIIHSATALDVWDGFFTTMKSELASLHGTTGVLYAGLPTQAPTGGQPDAAADSAVSIQEKIKKAVTAQGGGVGTIFYHSGNKHFYELTRVEIVGGEGHIDDRSFLPITFYEVSGAGKLRTRVIPEFPLSDSGWVTNGQTGVLYGHHQSDTTSVRIRYLYQDLGTGGVVDEQGGGEGGAGDPSSGPHKNLALAPDASGSYDYALEHLARRYSSQMDQALAVAGIIPSPKSDASTGAAGDSCWQDLTQKSHWWVDVTGEYLPVFTNHPYVSARRNSDGEIVSTQEFGFGLVTKCESRLKEGDAFTITIGGAGSGPYTAGDVFVVPVVAAHGAEFTGGGESDATQTWSVHSDLLGSLPDWMWHPDTQPPYADGPVTARLSAGAIPFEVGDKISVALEGGRLRWRRDGGAWVEGDLFNASHDLGDGLQLSALPGAAPSFVEDDRWQFGAIASYGTSRLRQPRIGEAYAWDGDATTVDVDFGQAEDVEAVLLALHSLPRDAVVTLSGGEFAHEEWQVSPIWSDGAILAPLPEVRQVRYLRLSVTGAGDGASIGWLWAGLGWRPTVGASELTLSRQYGMTRGRGRNAGGLYRGRGMGGHWSWKADDGSGLFAQAADELVKLVDHVAEQGIEPVCLVPDLRDPMGASLALLDTDEIQLRDDLHWQYAAGRFVGVDLPFRAVLG